MHSNNIQMQQMRHRLSQMEAGFARLINRLPGMAYRCKVDDGNTYTLEFVSKASQSLLGMPPEEVLSSRTNVIERMMEPEDLIAIRASMAENLTARQPYEVFYRISPADGTPPRWIWDQGEGIFDEKGRCIYIEGIMMDATEQKSKEELLEQENRHLRLSIKNAYGLGSMVGNSEAMQRVYDLVIKAANSDVNVVLYGETGVGKDLAARTIHELSGVKGRYVPVNCAAIPEQLLESEFFGHMKGAFSGAVSNHTGYLASADGGTLFLDEIGELPLKLQVKLLRAIESKTFTPVGASEPKRSNFRLISATNQDVQEMVRQKAMREDFFYRIHVLAVHLPPLRERLGDLPLLIDTYARERGITMPLPVEMRLAMEQYTWPGNVRELQNALDRFRAFGETNIGFRVPALQEPEQDCRPAAFIQTGPRPAPNATSLSAAKGEAEKYRILAMLEQNQWKKGITAAALGITMRTLQRKLKAYGISR